MGQSREIPDTTGFPAEQHVAEAPRVEPAAVARRRRRVPVWSLVLRAGLGLALIGLGLWFLQRETAPEPTPPAPAPDAVRPG